MENQTIIEFSILDKTYNSITLTWNLKSEIISNPYFLLEIFHKIHNWRLIYGGYNNSFKIRKLHPGPGSVYKFRLGIYDGELNELYKHSESIKWSQIYKACTNNHPYTVAQLNKAIEKDNIQLIKEIIKTRPCILEIEDSNTHSPIVKAVLCNNLPAITHLINTGLVDIDSPSILTGRTTLMIAVTNQFIKIVKYLIESNADINKQDINGCTALHYAIDVNSLPCLNYLVEKGADVSIPDQCGYSPLIRSVITDADNKIIEKIYTKWKNAIILIDNKGLTCIDHAMLNKRDDLIQLFTDKSELPYEKGKTCE